MRTSPSLVLFVALPATTMLLLSLHKILAECDTVRAYLFHEPEQDFKVAEASRRM